MFEIFVEKLTFIIQGVFLRRHMYELLLYETFLPIFLRKLRNYSLESVPSYKTRFVDKLLVFPLKNKKIRNIPKQLLYERYKDYPHFAHTYPEVLFHCELTNCD